MDDFLSALRKDMGSLKVADEEPIHDWEFFKRKNKVYTTKILSPGELAGDSDQFCRAKRLEVKGLNDRKPWAVVDKPELPTDANIIGGRFVLTIKEYETHKKNDFLLPFAFPFSALLSPAPSYFLSSFQPLRGHPCPIVCQCWLMHCPTSAFLRLTLRVADERVHCQSVSRERRTPVHASM